MVAQLTCGTADLRRVSRAGFPVFELVQDGEVLARTGRGGWWRIFFGRGQRIELADATSWRLRAVGNAGGTSQVIVDVDYRKVVIGSALSGGYGINGKDFAYRLFSDEPLKIVRPDVWYLRHHEEETAVVYRSRSVIEAAHEVPLAVVLISFSLARYGMPGERSLGLPSFQWGAR